MEEELKLPELPPPDVPDISGKFALGWSAVRMREYARQAVLAERERCARICETRAQDCEEEHQTDSDERWLVYAKHAKRLAAAIRGG